MFWGGPSLGKILLHTQLRFCLPGKPILRFHCCCFSFFCPLFPRLAPVEPIGGNSLTHGWPRNLIQNSRQKDKPRNGRLWWAKP